VKGTAGYVNARPSDVNRIQAALGGIVATQDSAILRVTSLHFHTKRTCNNNVAYTLTQRTFSS